MRVPLGVRDRQLDADCVPATQPDGRVLCEPVGAAPAGYFRDPACSEPVVTTAPAAPIPTVVRVVEPSGCAGFRAVGDEVMTGLYRHQGDTCVAAPLFPSPRAFAATAPVELVALERTPEVIAGRRLQRIALSDGELRFFDHRLYDTATRAECRGLQIDAGDQFRCVPAVTSTALRLYTAASCAVSVDVTELPVRGCARPAFALTAIDGAATLHAIGDPVTSPLHYFDGLQCAPYTPDADHVVYALGPPIDPTAFAGALYYGER
jgi:hypothetical protein